MEHSQFKLLIQCLRVEEPGQKAARVTTFSPSDWETVMVQARQHGLTPMLAWQLSALSPAVSPPEDIRQELRQSLLVSTGRNLVLYNELGKVLRQLKQADIPVIVLKGAHLAAIVYEHLGLRMMSDIDLLVNVRDIKKSSQVLTAMDYQTDVILPGSESTHFEKHHLPDFYKPNARPIEIHWTILNDNSPFRIEIEQVWKEAWEATIAGYPTLALSPRDQIVYLCMHTYAHSFSLGLRPFVDLLQVSRHYQESIQWEQVKQRAQDWKASRCVFLMLYTANRLFGSPSEAVLEVLKPADFDPQLVEVLSNKIIREQLFEAEMKNDIEKFVPSLYFIKLIGNLNLAEKATLLWKRIFLPPKTLAQHYKISPDSPRLYFYYLLRVKDLLSHYGRLSYQKATRSVTKDKFANPDIMLAEWIASE